MKPVKLLNRNKDLVFFIDEIDYNEKAQMMLIRGWGFTRSQLPIQYHVNNHEFKMHTMQRDDVFQRYPKEYKNTFRSGFLFQIKDVKKDDVFHLEIQTPEYTQTAQISVDAVLRAQRRGVRFNVLRIFSPRNILHAIGFFFRFGPRSFAQKARRCVADRQAVSSIYDPFVAYEQWQNIHEFYNPSLVQKEIKAFPSQPKISIVMPVYNVDEIWLKKCINSILKQYYGNWELCIADDCSTKKHIRPLLESYRKKDPRIKVVYRTENGHISRATNSALELVTGEFVALMDNDDELPPWALYEVVKCINQHPDADLIYSDEDKLDTNGERTDPHFKPDWSPESFLSSNYISHLGVYRKTILDQIGGFRPGYEGAQDYDLALRFTEQTDHIYHIPRILYHWRIIEGSTSMGASQKNYAYLAGKKALEDAVKRRGYRAMVEEVEDVPYYNVNFQPNRDSLISIIIPTRDKADVLRRCLESIYEKTTWKNYEIIVVDNNSEEKATFRLFEEYQKKENFKVLRMEIPFNYSKLNNAAVKEAKGDLILLLNNDVEVITEDWLERMAGEAQRKEIGAVGAKLYYPNDTVQHAGVVLGVGGVANHAFATAVKADAGYHARLRIRFNYSAVTAACLMVRREVYDQVGGLEEELQVAFNDVDFCLKILKAGYRNLMVPDAELYHYESLSRGPEDNPEKMARFLREIKYMEDHWNDLLKNDPCYSPNFSLEMPSFQIRTRLEPDQQKAE